MVAAPFVAIKEDHTVSAADCVTTRVEPALKIMMPPCVLYGSEPSPPTHSVSPAGISVIGAAEATPAQHKETATVIAVATNERLNIPITILLFKIKIYFPADFTS
jgi:hypothetical protein